MCESPTHPAAGRCSTAGEVREALEQFLKSWGSTNSSTKSPLMLKANHCKGRKRDPQTCPAPSRIRSSHLTCHSAWGLT